MSFQFSRTNLSNCSSCKCCKASIPETSCSVLNFCFNQNVILSSNKLFVDRPKRRTSLSDGSNDSILLVLSVEISFSNNIYLFDRRTSRKMAQEINHYGHVHNSLLGMDETEIHEFQFRRWISISKRLSMLLT